MSLPVQAISSHPVLIRAVEEVLTEVKKYTYLPTVPNEEEATRRANLARLFLLDTCSLHTDLGALVDRCSASSPGSKFILLVAPAKRNDATKRSDAEKIRLLHHGIEGFVELSETWKAELPQAIRSVLGGQYWVRPQILAAFFKQTQALEQARLLRFNLLTDREGQILRLLMRCLANKEISRHLAISERTVKFHVTHILAKFGCEDRRGLRDLLPRIYANQENVFELEQGAQSNINKTSKKPSLKKASM